MDLDLRAVAANMRRAETESLLDRVTVYRDEMEPAAVDLIEGELARRGVRPDEVAAHARGRRASALFRTDGTAVRCHFCERPAVVKAPGWYKLWGRVPVFPWVFAYCEEHRPGAGPDEGV